MSVVAILDRVRAGHYMKKPQTRLTNHQIQVLALVCDDMPMKAIAVTLGRSIKTVEKHRQSINKFAGTHSPIGLYKWAIANGYVEAPVRTADW